MEQHLLFPHTDYGGGRGDDEDIFKYLNFPDDDCADPLGLPPHQPPPPPPAIPGAAFPATPDDVDEDDFEMSFLDCVDDSDMQFWDDIDIIDDGDVPLMIEGPSAAVAAVAGVSGDHQYGQPGKSPAPDDPASPVWASAEHLDCTCCHLLRVVVHSDGERRMKLALHGGVGVFYHAILDVYYDMEGLNVPAVERSYIDLQGQNLEWVKQFLINYGLLRCQERYLIMEDSLSSFYDVLCVSMSYQVEKKTAGQAMPLPAAVSQPVGVDPSQSKQVEMYGGSLMAKSRVRIAAQRERTKRLHLKDLAGYVHLPITEAAKRLQICPTALKKVCRKHGIHRWPYRKVRSLDREISSLQKELRSATPEEALNAQAKIEKLRAERARVCAGLPP